MPIQAPLNLPFLVLVIIIVVSIRKYLHTKENEPGKNLVGKTETGNAISIDAQ